MHIQLPNAWDVFGVPKGKRKSVKIPHYEIVDFEVREVSAADAPICIASPETEVRFFEDGFWYPLSSEDPYFNPAEDEQIHTELLSEIADLKDKDLPEIFKYRNRVLYEAFRVSDLKLRGIGTFSSEDYKSIEASDQKENLTELAKRVDECVLIDGWLWKKSNDPVIKLEIQRGGQGRIVPIAEQGDIAHSFGAFAVFDFSMDTDTIHHLANTHFQWVHDWDGLKIPQYEVLMPDVITDLAVQLQFARLTWSAANDWWNKKPDRLGQVDPGQLGYLQDIICKCREMDENPTLGHAMELDEIARDVVANSRAENGIKEGFQRAISYLEDAQLNHDLSIEESFAGGQRP